MDRNSHITVGSPFDPRGLFCIANVLVAHILAGALVDLGERVQVDIEHDQQAALLAEPTAHESSSIKWN